MMKILMIFTTFALLNSVPAQARKVSAYTKKTGMMASCMKPPAPPAHCTYSNYAQRRLLPYSKVEGTVINNQKDGNFDLMVISDGCFGPATLNKLRFTDPERRKSGRNDTICVASAECNERPGYFGVVVCSAVNDACPANPQDCADDESIEAYK